MSNVLEEIIKEEIEFYKKREGKKENLDKDHTFELLMVSYLQSILDKGKKTL